IPEIFQSALYIFRGFNAQTLCVRFSNFDPISVLQPSQLFKRLSFFQRRHWQLSNIPQDVGSIGIQTYVLIKYMLARPLTFGSVMDIWDGCPTKIQRCAGAV